MPVTGVDLMLGKVPSNTPRCLCIWEDANGDLRIARVGMTLQEAARLSYEIADEMIRQTPADELPGRWH